MRNLLGEIFGSFRKPAKNKMKSIKLYVLALSVYCSLANAVQMRIDSPTAGYAVDELFTIDVMLDATNTSNEDVVVADAVIQYETEMLELVSVATDSSTDSDFYYGYTLPTSTFPIVRSDTSGTLATVQVVVGLPGTAPVLSTNTNSRVAKLQFRAKAPPAGRNDNSTVISLVYTDGSDYTQSKVIANDGLGTNLLTSVSPALITIGGGDVPPQLQVPFPLWGHMIFALGLLGATVMVTRFGSRKRSTASASFA